jgi:NAD(P)H dehydrogenase (quinone)
MATRFMKKNILIIDGHPNPNSLCSFLAETYFHSAKQSDFSVELLQLNKLNFQPNLTFGYQSSIELEEDLLKSQRLISKADHLVFVFPSWWASLPALLKAFIDRVFLPGFAFQYQKNSPFPKKLLTGKSALLVITMDAPSWYYKWFNGSPGVKILKKGTLEFCGVSPVRVLILDKIRKSKKDRLEKLINKVKELGKYGS